MGQAFYESLPEELRRMGGEVVYVDHGPTEVRVLVRFQRARTADNLQARLWDTWPACSIGVQPFNP